MLNVLIISACTAPNARFTLTKAISPSPTSISELLPIQTDPVLTETSRPKQVGALPTNTSQPTINNPSPTTTPPVDITNDIIFATPLQDGASEWQLDVYTPHNAGPWPVIVLLHGMGISKGRFVSESLALAEQGVVVFTPSWPTGRIAVFSQDRGKKYRELYEVMTCAVRYARANAGRFGGDASQVAMVGHSAGAAYGSWVALGGEGLNDEWEAFAATHGSPAQQVSCVESGFSGEVESFVGIGGQFWFSNEIQEVDEELAKVVNPHLQIGSRPTMKVRLLHGERDNISVEHAMNFNQSLTSEGYDSKVILFDGGHIVPIDLTVEVIYELAGY